MIAFQLEAEFTRLTNVNARRAFFQSLDDNADHLLLLLVKDRSGLSGKMTQQHLSDIDVATVSMCNLHYGCVICLFVMLFLLHSDGLYGHLSLFCDQSQTSAIVKQ